MKIAYAVQYYPPHTGGLELVAQKQAESAVKNGHAVSLVTFQTKGMRHGKSDEKGIVVHRIRGFHFFDTRFSIPFCIGGIGMIRALHREVRSADIVHIHDVFYMISWTAHLLARLYGKPTVITQHVALVEHTSGFVMAIERLVYGTIGKRMLRTSSSVIVYNSVVKDFLVHDMGVSSDKVLQIRNGVSVKVFTPATEEERRQEKRKLGLPEDRNVVLFVGRFVPKKGLASMYGARSDAYDVALVGTGKLSNEWYEAAGVHILGERTQDELVHIYRAADAFAAPSKGETFTLVMQEAMASGLPVIAFDGPGYNECGVDRNYLLLCEPDADALKRSLLEAVSTKERKAAMGAYSRKLAEERFDWEKNVMPVMELYKNINRKHRQVAVTTSWDDGHVLDLRIAGLLKQYGMRGTFYVAPQNSELHEKERLSDRQIRELSQDFEIGAHTMTHADLRGLVAEEAKKEILGSKIFLEEITGKPVTSFCYPRGKYSSSTIHAVKAAGFAVARTVRRFVLRPDRELPLETGTSVHAYDHWSDILHIALFARFSIKKFFSYYRHWDELAIAQFERVKANGGVFHLWGHSWEVDAHGDWNRLDRVLKHISGRTNIRYIENATIYDA